MSSIVNALTDLVKSLLEVVWSFFTTAGELVQKTFQFTLSFASGILNLVIDFFRGLVDLAGGLVSFILGKFCAKRRVGKPLWTFFFSFLHKIGKEKLG